MVLADYLVKRGQMMKYGFIDVMHVIGYWIKQHIIFKNFSAAAELIACEVKIDGQYRQIPAGSNQTINKYWYSCELDEIKQKYSKGF